MNLDLALFFNRYEDLRTWRAGTPYLEGMPPQMVVPSTMVNGMEGDTYGGELTLGWRPMAWLHLQATYSLLKMDLHDPENDDYFAILIEGESPEHQISLRTGVDLNFGLTLDFWLRFVDELPASSQQVPSYWTMDARIGWRIHPNWEVALVGQNLFEPRHTEFVSEAIGIWPAKIERSVYGKVTWRF